LRATLSGPTEMQLAIAHLQDLQTRYNLVCGLNASNRSLFDCAVARATTASDILEEARQIKQYLTSIRARIGPLVHSAE
jgi:hypothetical protein